MHAALSTQTIAARLGQALGASVEITARVRLSGGNCSVAERLESTAGVFFLKSSTEPLTGIFSSEARSLEALRQGAGEALKIPRVIAFQDPDPIMAPRAGAMMGQERGGFLLTEFVQPGRRSADFDDALGHGLAALHRTTAPSFGFEVDTYCGATQQPNREVSDWLTFYRDARLGHQIAMGTRRGLFDARARRDLARLLDVLADRLATEPEPTALIHGDLWPGNLLVGASGPALVDPSASFSHREAEFGMMTLFGGFSPRVFAAYDEAFPLPPGWRARNPLYQLYHVLNHANLFGGGYAVRALEIARNFL